VSGWRARLLRVLLAVTSLALTLFVLEVGFRIKAVYDDRELSTFRELGNEAVTNRPDARLRTRHIIRLSGNDRIIFELIPGVTGGFRGAPLEVNPNGFRGPVLGHEKPKGTVRIAGIGDSVMFGWGVRDDEYYMARLGAKLASDFPDVSWEWLNSGVPGYNTAMEVETLKDKLLAYEPDLVVLGYCDNDLSLPNFIRNEEAYLTPRKSWLYHWARNAIKGFARTADDRLTKARTPEELPEIYRELVGIDAYRRSIGELVRLSEAHDFRIVVFSHTRLQDEVREITEEFELPIVEGQGALDAWMQANDVVDFMGSALTLNDHDPHPTPLAHDLISDELYTYLRESGLIDELRADALAQRSDVAAGSP